MKRSYGGAFYPQYPRPLKRAGTGRIIGLPYTPTQQARVNAMRAAAVRRYNSRARLTGLTELKAVDIPFGAGDAMGLTAVITPLNLIQAGSSYFNRVGRKIELKSLTLKGVCATTRTVTNESIGRVAVVYDRQTNGALPTFADMFQTTDQSGTNSSGGYSGINLNYRDRFQIIRDWKVYLPSLTDTAGVITNTGHQDQMSSFPNYHFHAKLKGLQTQYRADSSPAVIGDIATGGLFLVVWGSIASASTGWSFFYETRLRYTDK